MSGGHYLLGDCKGSGGYLWCDMDGVVGIPLNAVHGVSTGLKHALLHTRDEQIRHGPRASG